MSPEGGSIEMASVFPSLGNLITFKADLKAGGVNEANRGESKVKLLKIYIFLYCVEFLSGSPVSIWDQRFLQTNILVELSGLQYHQLTLNITVPLYYIITTTESNYMPLNKCYVCL